ncbi:MAG: suppressor of fused domain protein [Lentisphaeraceae bacterium]|nr:suppressor of fused domain protein [Lentisphaeraceae bacterium]
MVSTEDRLKYVYLEYLVRFGKPNGYFSFKSEIEDEGMPKEVVVFYWLANKKRSSNIFCTLGMSTEIMEDGEMAEMHLTVKDKTLDEDQIIAFCRFIANFSMYPFLHEFAMDWWNLIVDVGQIPVYPDSQSLLIHPEFTDEKFVNIEMGEETIKFFNIVPLTKDESAMVESDGVIRLLDYIEENEIDMFQIR